MIYLKTFKLSNNKSKNSNIYPFNVLKDKQPDLFLFDNITVLYGNNGSGKSTMLNIIAHKLNLKGKERNYSKVNGWWPYFEEFCDKCEYELAENENGRKINRLPENSRYIKSEEILYEIRKIQQEAVLQESIESNLSRIPMTMEDWANRIDKYLLADDRDILKNAGEISHKIASEKAISEFEKYRVIQDRLYKSDFDKLIESSNK